jgi:signal transduction histidine kinase
MISLSSCNYLLGIIDDILDLSRLELNQFTLAEDWFSLSKCVKEIFDIL